MLVDEGDVEWTIISEEDQVSDAGLQFKNSIASLWSGETSSKTVAILLVDGTARSRRHWKTSLHLLPLSSDADFYIGLVYGDYPPWSTCTVATFYMGKERQGLYGALKELELAGGSSMRNAFHEGIAASLDCVDLFNAMESLKISFTVTAVCSSLPYEHFYPNPTTRCCSKRHRDMRIDQLVFCFRDRNIGLNILCAHKEIASAMGSLLSKTFRPNEIHEVLLDGWINCVVQSEAASSSSDRPMQSVSSESPPSVSPSLVVDEVKNELEAAAKQFLASVLRMLPGQRAEAIKKQLESPAYSAEYKQAVIRMVKQMQQSISTKKPSPPPANVSHGSVRHQVPLWRGRIAFQLGTESFFEVAGFPVKNPKGSTPSLIPHPSEFMVESWPLVLAVASFVSVQSPAVAKIVPVSRLVELVPVSTVDGKPGQMDESTIVFRNLLVGRQLVGLVRLGANQVMLIAARPHQLVGMVISKHVAAALVAPEVSSPMPGSHAAPLEPAHITRAQAQAIRNQQKFTPHAAAFAPQLASPLPPSHNYQASQSWAAQRPSVPLLTPDAILRQLHSTPRLSSSEMPPSDTSENSNMDVFNALIGSHSMDFDDTLASPLDFPGEASYQQSTVNDSLFDLDGHGGSSKDMK